MENDENSRKFSRRIENTVGKGEIARNEQFLLFSYVKNQGLFGKRLSDYTPFSFIKFLPNDKILDWSKFKAPADDKINVTQNLKFVLGKVENILGKGENAGYHHFHLFPKCFQKSPSSGSLKVGIVWKRVKQHLAYLSHSGTTFSSVLWLIRRSSFQLTNAISLYLSLPVQLWLRLEATIYHLQHRFNLRIATTIIHGEESRDTKTTKITRHLKKFPNLR